MPEGASGDSTKGSTRPRGGTGTGTAGRIGNGLGVVGFAVDIYFAVKQANSCTLGYLEGGGLGCIVVPYA